MPNPTVIHFRMILNHFKSIFETFGRSYIHIIPQKIQRKKHFFIKKKKKKNFLIFNAAFSGLVLLLNNYSIIITYLVFVIKFFGAVLSLFRVKLLIYKLGI